MKKSTKKFTSTFLAAASVAGIVVPATQVLAEEKMTVEQAKALVEKAKKDKVFAEYNIAYAAILQLDKSQQDALLAELAPLWKEVVTPDVQKALDMITEVSKKLELKEYDTTLAYINKEIKNERNMQYLAGDLARWGENQVYTDDVKVAVDAIVKVWTEKTEAAEKVAKEAIAKVKNANNVTYLNAQLAEASEKVVREFKVESVTANSAKSFVVKFNKAVEDTSKLVTEVKRSSTVVTLTTTWNADKTEATLTSSANLPEGSYAVNVKYDSKDLGTSTVAITQQKIAKIEITSNKLAVVQSGLGYVTYKVLDQYNNDITSSYLASNIKFQTGVGNATHKNGIITITPHANTNLIQFANVAITGYETTSGVSVNATLATATTLGTLSDFKLGDIKDIVLTAGDVTSVFYVPYTAYDMSGNETKNYDLVKGGLILNNGLLSVTNPNVKAELVRDPADSSKAAIELKVTNTDNILVDMPLTIMSMTYTGKNSFVETKIRKAKELDTFTLMAPAYNIAVGDVGKTIPFEAYDQAGNKITKFSELDGKVTLNGGIKLERNVDGTAKVVITPITSEGTQFLSATVASTAKMSTLSLSIQKPAVAESLELDSSVFVSAMENGAKQSVDFGASAGGLKVKDQFGRDIDMVTGTNNYKVSVATSGNQIGLSDTVLTTGNSSVELTASAPDGNSGTVTFTLFNDADGNGSQGTNEATIDTKSVSLSVIKSDDIKGYTISEVTAPVYANPNFVGFLTARDKAYAANPEVYGKTASGSKVLLANNPVVGAYVDNASDFAVVTTPGAIGLAYDGVKVAAGKLSDPTKAQASTTLTVTVADNKGGLHPLTTTIKSSTEAPKATDVGFTVTRFVAGLAVNGDVVTINAGNLADANFVDGAYVANYRADGSVPALKSKVVFWAKDQYGKKAMQLAQFRIVDSKLSGATVSIDDEGKLSINGALIAGNELTISAVTNNGLVKTIKVVIK